MAVLYITEYTEVTVLPPGWVTQAPLEPPIAEQMVAISGASAVSNPFNSKTTYVRLHTDAICSVLFGVSTALPLATTSNQRLSANQTEYKGVRPGTGYAVAVISNT